MRVIKNVTSDKTVQVAFLLQEVVNRAIAPLIHPDEQRHLRTAPAVYVEQTHPDIWTVNSNLPDRAETLEATALAAVEAFDLTAALADFSRCYTGTVVEVVKVNGIKRSAHNPQPTAGATGVVIDVHMGQRTVMMYAKQHDPMRGAEIWFDLEELTPIGKAQVHPGSQRFEQVV